MVGRGPDYARTRLLQPRIVVAFFRASSRSRAFRIISGQAMLLMSSSQSVPIYENQKRLADSGCDIPAGTR